MDRNCVIVTFISQYLKKIYSSQFYWNHQNYKPDLLKQPFKILKNLKELKVTGQNGAGMRSGLHMPAHAKLKTHMGYITHLEHGGTY